MKQTPNLLLKMPEPTDFVLVEDFNENFTKIDTEIAKITDEETGVEAKLAKHLDEDANDAHEIKNIIGLQSILNEKADALQNTQQQPDLLNGWVSVNVNTVQFYKDSFGVVHVSGRIHQGVTTEGTVLFNLPEFHRPSLTTFRNTVTYSTIDDLTPCILSIDSDGDVSLAFSSNTFINLDFSFRV